MVGGETGSLRRHTKPTIGDVVEIPLSTGFAYAQYTHEHEEYGELLRVLPGEFAVRPKDFADLVRDRERYFQFYPLAEAVRHGLVTIAGSEEVPESARQLPLFRSGERGGPWWLWDGAREWPVDELTPEQRQLSILGIANHKYLIELVETGWRPEDADW
jgi:hypothetical protein